MNGFVYSSAKLGDVWHAVTVEISKPIANRENRDFIYYLCYICNISIIVLKKLNQMQKLRIIYVQLNLFNDDYFK